MDAQITRFRSSPSIQRYIFRQVLLTFLIVEGSIIGVSWVIGSLVHLRWVINNGMPWREYLYYNLLVIPVSFRAFVTSATTIAVIFAYNRLISDRESVVINAAGLSTMNLAKPALLLAGILSAFLVVHLSFFAPLANRETRAMRHDVRNAGLVLNLKEKEFTSVADDLTIYVGKRYSSAEFADVLVWETKEKDAPATIAADQAKLHFDHGRPFFILSNGSQQVYDRRTRETSITEFEQYTFNLEQYVEEARSLRIDIREMFIHDLWAAAFADPPDPALQRHFYSRVAAVFRVFAVVVAVLAILLSGGLNRHGQVWRVIAAVATLFATEAAIASLINASVSGLFALFLLFGLMFALAGGGLWVIARGPMALSIRPLLTYLRRAAT